MSIFGMSHEEELEVLEELSACREENTLLKKENALLKEQLKLKKEESSVFSIYAIEIIGINEPELQFMDARCINEDFPQNREGTIEALENYLSLHYGEKGVKPLFTDVDKLNAINKNLHELIWGDPRENSHEGSIKLSFIRS